MPDITTLVKRWWKQIFFAMLLSLLAVGVITFMKPRQYLSVATAVPASSYASDKSKIFSENIEALYSALGTADDLDRVLGTAKLDTVYLAVADRFNLFDHYKVKEKGDAARIKSASLLKKNTVVMKSEYGELKVKVWDTDKYLAPQMANAVLEQLQAMHTSLLSAGNKATLKALIERKEKIQQQADSASADRNELLKSQLATYEKTIGEYGLIVDSKPPALITVENAKPATRPDRPRRMQIMAATAVLSLLFALLAAVVLERKK